MQRFLYFGHDRLSPAELSAARLDGHLVEIGEGYMPADAVETAAMRAASLLPLLRRGEAGEVAAAQLSAAWIHGAVDDPPARHVVQRAVTHRLRWSTGARTRYSDALLPRAEVQVIGGILVTTPARTLADLARAETSCGTECAGVTEAVLRMSSAPGATRSAIISLAHAGAVPHKRAALARLRTLEQRYDVVTR